MRRAFSYAIPLVVLLPAAALQAQDAAHSLAQKFAVEDRKALKKPVNGPAARPKAAPPAAQRTAQAPRPQSAPDYEAEMLDAARAEAQARKAQDGQAQAGQAQDRAAVPKPAVPASVAESKPVAATPAPAPVPAPAPAPAQPAATAPATAAAPAAAATPAAKAPAAPVQIKIDAQIKTPAPAPAPSRDTNAPRASVLVVLAHDAESSGSMPKTFDPVICFADTCYVSTGAASDAKLVSRAQALSTRQAITAGAGACAGKPACAFRGVSVPPGGQLQIVDLGLVKHDPRDTVEAKIDSTCTIDQGDLMCNSPLTAPDYRVWIVPEQLAAELKPESIESALADELPEENITLETDK